MLSMSTTRPRTHRTSLYTTCTILLHSRMLLSACRSLDVVKKMRKSLRPWLRSSVRWADSDRSASQLLEGGEEQSPTMYIPPYKLCIRCDVIVVYNVQVLRELGPRSGAVPCALVGVMAIMPRLSAFGSRIKTFISRLEMLAVPNSRWPFS